MKKTIVVFIAIIFFIPGWAFCENLSGDINILYGKKNMDSDWKPTDELEEFGLMSNSKPKSLPFFIALDYIKSSDEDTEDYYISNVGYVNADLELETSELAFGFRSIYEKHGQIRPYVGGGLAFITLDASAEVLGITVSDDDTSLGFWFDTGLMVTFSNIFNVGFDFRWSKADISVFDEDYDAGGIHYLFLFGFHY